MVSSHPSPNTAKQVYNGLSGLLYIEDDKRIIILAIMGKMICL